MNPPLPALVACAHGTRDPAGRRAVDQLRAGVASLRPGLRVVEAYVDVQQPCLPDALRDVGAAVVVPLVLSSGYHVNVDVAVAVEGAGRSVRAARALGPDPALVDVLAERLADAGLSRDHVVVLAAVGSSDPRAVMDVEHTARVLAQRLGRLVVPAYGSAAAPRVDEAVSRLAASGQPVAIGSYLLAPGHFHDQLRAAGADVLTAPLLPHPAVTALVLRRYDEAVMSR